MKKLWIGIAFALALWLIPVCSTPAFAGTDIGKLSLDTRYQ